MRASRHSPLIALLLATTFAQSAPALANSRHGAWSPLHNWPVMPIHTVVMRDGRILSFGTDTNGDQTGSLVYDVWDSKLGLTAAAHTTLTNETQTDIFCAGMLNLPFDFGAWGNQIAVSTIGAVLVIIIARIVGR